LAFEIRIIGKGEVPPCLEGERACSPEDCGGIWGYAEFVNAIQNMDNEEHEGMLKWVGGRFGKSDEGNEEGPAGSEEDGGVMRLTQPK
jgi:hypothetical protein